MDIVITRTCSFLVQKPSIQSNLVRSLWKIVGLFVTSRLTLLSPLRLDAEPPNEHEYAK